MNKKDTVSQQLLLDVKLKTHSNFENFICAPKNTPLLALLAELFMPATAQQSVATKVRYMYLHGGTSVGKTHLLHSVCHAADQQNLQTIYLPMSELCELSAESVLADLEDVPVICVDDIENIKDKPEWQRQLFYLYNKVREKNHYLFVTANTVPNKLDFELADLVSRLKWGLTYRIDSLDEQGLKTLFKQSLLNRGIRVDDEIIEYVLIRVQRNTSVLVDVIEQLDQVSLEKKRAITKPFIKELLNW